MSAGTPCPNLLDSHFAHRSSLDPGCPVSLSLTNFSCTTSSTTLVPCSNPSQPRRLRLQTLCQVLKKNTGAADARPAKLTSDPQTSIELDNESDESHTIIKISAPGRTGLLQAVIAVLKDLGLNIAKATVEYENGVLREKFWVHSFTGSKVHDTKDLQNVQRALYNALDDPITVKERDVKRLPPKLYTKREATPEESFEFRRRTDLLYRLMDQYLKNDVLSIQKSIVDHVEYTVARSRFRFDDFEAYQATAHSARDRLLESWNDTQQFFKDKKNTLLVNGISLG